MGAWRFYNVLLLLTESANSKAAMTSRRVHLISSSGTRIVTRNDSFVIHSSYFAVRIVPGRMSLC
jgi:hypothetical protein